jgi:Arc/MetJ family transcription regulator
MCKGKTDYTHREWKMRTNIELDDTLLAEAMAVTGLPTKKATVEEALRRLVRQHRQRKAIADMAGLGWEGDLDSMREGRTPDRRR